MSASNQSLTRIIPVLLVQGRGSLVKSVRFKNHVYVGDPQNAVKIFNEKEVDELIVLDISAAEPNREPDYKYVEQIATECFMPVTYGGGVASIESFSRVIAAGVEKVSLNSAALTNPDIVKQAADRFGSSSVVVTVDVKKDLFGRRKVYSNHSKKVSEDPVAYAQLLERNGAGEILLQSVDRDGTMEGYDLELIKSVSSSVKIPVIACGGAGTIQHFTEAMRAGASAVAAGSRFVFYGKHRAVLINYPDEIEKMSIAGSGQ